MPSIHGIPARPETQSILESIKLTPADTKHLKVKIRWDLKPDILGIDSTEVEYKLLAKSWQVLFLGYNYKVVPILEQQQALMQLLNKSMASKLD